LTKARVRRRNSLLEAIEQLRAIEPRINVSELLVFFYVAENPGINIAELAQVAGMNMATASRSVRALTSEETEGALPPYCGFIDIQPNPDDARGRLLFLSSAGKAVCGNLDRVIRNAVVIDG
jgi:DNA-binding MarR family transcriptional regulator